MKKTVTLLLLAITSITSLSVSAQNVGYINSDSVLIMTPGYLEALQSVAKEENKYETELKNNQAELKNKLDALVSKYNVKEGETFASLKARMSPTDTLSLSMIQTENALVANKKKTYEAMISSTYAENVQPILDKVNATIADYAKKNGIDAIYAMENLGDQLVYLNKERIITADIIKLVAKL